MTDAKPALIEFIHRALTERKAELDRLGVASLAVCGSVARGEARPESDMDILVEFRWRRHARPVRGIEVDARGGVRPPRGSRHSEGPAGSPSPGN